MTETKHTSGLNAAVAAELRAEKAAQGMSNDDLAAASGLSKPTIQRLLAAERAINVRYLEALANALGLDPVQLLVDARKRMTATAEDGGKSQSA